VSNIDPRIARGLVRQMELRSQRLGAGQGPIGWKAGLGAPASLERFSLSGPLVGFLTDASLVAPGGQVDISGWSRPVAEPELAAILTHDLEGGVDPPAARAAIATLAPAIELADVDPPPEEVEEILAGNIYHRAVILGQPNPARPGADLSGLTARARLNGVVVAETDRLEQITGELGYVLAHLAELLAGAGERIRAGDVVICGSIVAPIGLRPGDRFDFELPPFPPLGVRL
jgi:2-keto-4-pentenoate hydratase